uniref:Uncharacterized protein n=1 Tax=Oryza sativa subsp. japonica TaxID=39947 RepID=Q6Z526_ORYSJ|nr:hypothetical protein [Oryza sativa Japonica Group]BAD10157.1 hypothetical protein [Oryza sativa Japonica Group]
MALSANRLLTVLLCLLLLSHQQKVYGLKGISLAFGREEDEVPEKKPRVLAQSNAANLNNKGGEDQRQQEHHPRYDGSVDARR